MGLCFKNHMVEPHVPVAAFLMSVFKNLSLYFISEISTRGMCGIVINPPDKTPGRPVRYNRTAFLVSPPRKHPNNWCKSSPWEVPISPIERAPAVPAPSHSAVVTSPVRPTEQLEQPQPQLPTIPTALSPTPDTVPAVERPGKTPSEVNPTETTSSKKQATKGKKAKGPTASGTQELHTRQLEKVVDSKGRQARISTPKKVHFDIPKTATVKKVRFTMDPVTRSNDSATTATSTTSSLPGSDDSFVEWTPPNVPMGTKKSGRATAHQPTSKLPPNVVASSSSRPSGHHGDSSLHPIRKVDEWNLSGPYTPPPTPVVRGSSPPSRPGPPLSYVQDDDEDDLDSEADSTVDSGFVDLSSQTAQNTTWNAGGLSPASPAGGSDLLSEVASNVDEKPKPSSYRTPSSTHHPPDDSDSSRQEN